MKCRLGRCSRAESGGGAMAAVAVRHGGRSDNAVQCVNPSAVCWAHNLGEAREDGLRLLASAAVHPLQELPQLWRLLNKPQTAVRLLLHVWGATHGSSVPLVWPSLASLPLPAPLVRPKGAQK